MTTQLRPATPPAPARARTRGARWAARLLRWAGHPKALPGCVLAALLLTAPSAGTGLQLDDYVQRSVVLRSPPPEPGLETASSDLFHLSRGDVPRMRALMEQGFAPWWTDPEVRLSFLRPLSAWTHVLDWKVLRGQPVLMHVHSMLWYAALVLAAAAALRASLGAGAAAMLAAWIFALDDAHGLAVGWLANRNVLLAGTLGFLALAAHLRWRSGWRPGGFLAPALLALALLSAEAALGAAAYILAAALALEERDVRARLRSLAPTCAVLLAWGLYYKSAGYGAANTQLYTEPLGEPLVWARAALERVPVLLLGQWGLPTAGLYGLLARPWALGFTALGALAALGLAWMLLPLLRRDRRARFLALGSLLALLPVASTLPHDRLLVLSGLGAAGVLALWLEELARGTTRRRADSAVGMALIAVHLALAPLSLPATSRSAAFLERVQVGAFDAVLLDRPSRAFDVVLVQAPSALFSAYLPAVRDAQGLPLPRRVRMIAPATQALELLREDEATLRVRAPGGWFPPPGTGLEHDPSFAFGYILQHLEGLFRGRPLSAGELVELRDVRYEVLEVDAHGSPREVRVRFDRPLEAVDLAWITYQDGEFVPFVPPGVGARVRLEAQSIVP